MNKDCNDAFVTIDALLPPEMAARAERIGGEKTKLDTQTLLTLAVLAGAFIALARCSRPLQRPGPTASCLTDSLDSSQVWCFARPHSRCHRWSPRAFHRPTTPGKARTLI